VRGKARTCAACLLFLLIVISTSSAANQMQKQADGVLVQISGYLLRVQVMSDSVVRIAAAKDKQFFSRSSIDVLPHTAMTQGWKLASTSASVTISTSKVQVRVDRANGAVTFLDASGKTILAESEGGRAIEAANVQGENAFHVSQGSKSVADESLYGLGQQQLGIVDIKGYDFDLWQHNTNVVVPFLVSSKGYGILWDNTSYTHFGDLRQFEPVPAANLLDGQGASGGLTVQPVDGSEPAKKTNDISLASSRENGAPRPKNMRWEGSIAAPATGDYQFQTYSAGGIKVWINNKLVIDHWRQGWLASNDQVKIAL